MKKKRKKSQQWPKFVGSQIELNEIQSFDFLATTFNDSEIKFSTSFGNAIKALFSGENKNKWQKGERPDFYSDELGYMLEAFEIDDISFKDQNGKIYNPLKEWRYRRWKLVSKELREKGYALPPILRSFPSPETLSSFRPSYAKYKRNFQRVLNKHIRSIHAYREAHPDLKLIFFIYDISVQYSYFENERFELHNPFNDKDLIEELQKLEIDNIIWLTNNKHLALMTVDTDNKVEMVEINKKPTICIMGETDKEIEVTKLKDYSNIQLLPPQLVPNKKYAEQDMQNKVFVQRREANQVV